MKYVKLDANNLPLSFYDDAINTTIPTGAVSLTQAQWQEFIDNNGARQWDATTNTVIPYAPPFNLTHAQALKKQQIRAAFTTAAALPVTDANGIIWDGGYDSALKLDAAKRMAELAALTNVTLFDSTNTAQTLTIAQANTVILAIGADYQTKFTTKQSLMAQVDALATTATQADLDAIIITI